MNPNPFSPGHPIRPQPETPFMSQLTIRRITITVISLLGAALFEFCALFVQVNQAVNHTRLGAITAPAADVR